MLSKAEREEIRGEIAAHHNPRAACIEVLKLIQRHRRWVPDEELREAAELLGMSPEELDGVATFYNLIFRRPVGRHVVHLCDSVSCWIMGSDGLEAALSERLGIGPGQTTADDRFTLLPIACLGNCERAPALMIGDDVHHGVGVEDLQAILDRYR